MAGQSMGFIHLESTNGQKNDACLVLVENSVPGTRIFVNLGNIRFIKTDVPKAPPAVVADVLVNDATTNSSSSTEHVYSVKNDTHTKVSKPGKQQQQSKRPLRQRNQHVGQQQGNTVSAASRTSLTTTLKPSPCGANRTSSPDKRVISYNNKWVTKAMRQVVPGWVLTNSPSKIPDIEDRPDLANEALPAKYAAAGGRKAGPRKGTVTSSNVVSDMKQRSAATVAPYHRTAVHLGGITRHHLHQHRQGRPTAAHPQGSGHAEEDQQFVTRIATNNLPPGPKNRFRLSYPEVELQDEVHLASTDVIGALPDSNSVARQDGPSMGLIKYPDNANHQPDLGVGAPETPVATLGGRRNGDIMSWDYSNAASPALPGGVDGSGWVPLASAVDKDNDKEEHATPILGYTVDTRTSTSGWVLAASPTGDGNDKAGRPSAGVHHSASSDGKQGMQSRGSRTQKGANAYSSVHVDNHTYAVFAGVLVQPAATRINRRYLKPTVAMEETEMQALKAASAHEGKEHMVVSPSSGNTPDIGTAWQALRHKNSWPHGQGVFESMFSPYHAEMIDACQACQPRV